MFGLEECCWQMAICPPVSSSINNILKHIVVSSAWCSKASSSMWRFDKFHPIVRGQDCTVDGDLASDLELGHFIELLNKFLYFDY